MYMMQARLNYKYLHVLVKRLQLKAMLFQEMHGIKKSITKVKIPSFSVDHKVSIPDFFSQCSCSFSSYTQSSLMINRCLFHLLHLCSICYRVYVPISYVHRNDDLADQIYSITVTYNVCQAEKEDRE